MIHKFNSEGTLKEDHVCDWEQLQEIWGYNSRRKQLLLKIKPHLYTLKNAGVTNIKIGGSFASNKAVPEDIDAVFNLKEVDEEWCDDVVPLLDDDFKEKCGTEFFGGDTLTKLNNEPHEKFFRRGRDGEKRGLIIVNLDSLP